VIKAPSWSSGDLVVTRINAIASAENISVNISVQLADGLDPPALYLGSPTILINGVDLEPSARTSTEYRFGWRSYDGSDAPGVLGDKLIRAQLRQFADMR